MDYKNEYLSMKKKYLELKYQIGGTRENILRLLSSIDSMNDYLINNNNVLPISYEPQHIPNNLTMRVERNGILYGYALIRDYNKLAADGGRQLLVTNLTVHPLLSQVGYELLRKIINYGRQNNYRYLLFESPNNISRFNNKFILRDNNANYNDNYIIYKL